MNAARAPKIATPKVGDVSLQPAAAVRRPVNLRSVLIGLLGVVTICGFTPYNDYVLGNTPMVGSALPVGLLLWVSMLVLLVNAPLSRWRPRLALSGGELAVILGMMLVSCTLPSTGLMRFLPGNLIGPWRFYVEDPQMAKLVQKLNLPDWMFPTMHGSTPAARANDPVVRDFVGNIPLTDGTLLGRWAAIPWSAWLRPALTWGLLLAFLYGGIMCMSILVIKQWSQNERLQFPLASVYLSLIEPPPPGRALNRLLRSAPFWLAFTAVFAVHGINGMHRYLPKYVPAIPVSFALNGLFRNPPLSYTDWRLFMQTMSFAIIGVTFFIQTKIAFSLWITFMGMQIVRMYLGTWQRDLLPGMEYDQTQGAVVFYGLTILWIGRHHLAMVGRQMFGRTRSGEESGRYIPYWMAGWGMVFCAAGLSVWLYLAGASWMGAIVIVLGLGLAYLTVARVVAETGLTNVSYNVILTRPFVYAANYFNMGTKLESFYFGSLFHGLFSFDNRESLSIYSTHALRVADESAYEQKSSWRGTVSFVLVLALALGVGYVAAGASYLYCDYSYTTTRGRIAKPVNAWGTENIPHYTTLDQTRFYMENGKGMPEPHNRLLHFGIGAGVTGLLGMLRLRFESWPLHPLGFLMVHSPGVRAIWFSIFLGWLAKVMLVRWGGGKLYQAARPFFIGLILGEAAAAGVWLLVAVVRLSLGFDYRAIQLLPN